MKLRLQAVERNLGMRLPSSHPTEDWACFDVTHVACYVLVSTDLKSNLSVIITWLMQLHAWKTKRFLLFTLSMNNMIYLSAVR